MHNAKRCESPNGIFIEGAGAMRYAKKPLITFGVLIVICLLLIKAVFWCWLVVMPTGSSPHKLTLAKMGYFYLNKVTLEEFDDDMKTGEHILELTRGLYHQMPQEYKLPKLHEGQLKVKLDTEYGDSYIEYYTDSDEVYKRGLLIYFVTDYYSNIEIDGTVYYDNYLYFISGRNKVCYYQKAGEEKWKITTDGPKLKKIMKQWEHYSPLADDGHKENKWVYKKEGSFGDEAD